MKIHSVWNDHKPLVWLVHHTRHGMVKLNEEALVHHEMRRMLGHVLNAEYGVLASVEVEERCLSAVWVSAGHQRLHGRQRGSPAGCWSEWRAYGHGAGGRRSPYSSLRLPAAQNLPHDRHWLFVRLVLLVRGRRRRERDGEREGGRHGGIGVSSRRVVAGVAFPAARTGPVVGEAGAPRDVAAAPRHAARIHTHLSLADCRARETQHLRHRSVLRKHARAYF